MKLDREKFHVHSLAHTANKHKYMNEVYNTLSGLMGQPPHKEKGRDSSYIVHV
jgi:hypothetical protein